jgi:hypothetical protein
MKKCTCCGKEYPDEATVCERDAEPLYDPNAPKPPAKAGVTKKSSASVSLMLAGISHLCWLIPMIAGNQVFHVGNQGVAELIPLIGLPVAIVAIVFAVRGFKTKAGLAIAGLIVSIIAIMACVAAVFALPGPLQPMIGM